MIERLTSYHSQTKTNHSGNANMCILFIYIKKKIYIYIYTIDNSETEVSKIDQIIIVINMENKY